MSNVSLNYDESESEAEENSDADREDDVVDVEGNSDDSHSNIMHSNINLLAEPSGSSVVEDEGDKHDQAIRLEDQMNNENLEALQQIFQEADEDGGGGLDLDEFRQAMVKTMAGKGEVPDDNQLAIIFMKVDANCDGTVDWEEFCSYMLLENQLKDVMTSDEREMEFPHPAREIPSAHRDTIPRITYFSKMSHGTDDPADNNVGRYVSVSKDGVLHFWSMDLHPLRTATLSNSHEGKAHKSVWITDCVVLPNAKKIAVSSADREIAFYDCSANSFEKQCVLSGLENCVLSMDYWYNPQNLNESILLFGDSGGCVSSIKFSAVNTGLFDLSIGQSIPSVTCRRIPFPELLLGRHPNVKAVQFTALHEDWVRKVKYYPSLQCFISCATSTNNSLYLGDVDRKKTSSMFRTRKGIMSFDYCKEWNVIVTGGLDHHVRLWNPYVTSKSTAVLKGHSASVTHVLVNGNKGEIISAAQDKVIKIWDIRDLCCVQTIPSRSLLPGPHVISSLYFNPKAHCILVGTNQLSVLEGKNEEPSEEREITSHLKPLCGALYNDLFDQVVSACHDSVVCVWGLDTGEKIIQFSNAHGDSEITAMSFDPSKRRLITGARHGTVKIWNFNNGCCLRILPALVDNDEITGILFFKQKIITVGWSKKVTIYKDCRDEEDDVPRVWPGFHQDDILSIALYQPSLVATSSYDGDIKVWNVETGHVSCVLNANQYSLNTHVRSVIPLDLKRRISKNNAVLSAVLADFNQESKETRRPSNIRSIQRNSPLLRDPALAVLSKRAKSICPVIPVVEVKDSDHDSVVDKVLFLQKREHHRETATLVTSGSGGWIRAWSVFGGGLLGQFMAAQTDRESVTSLATDEYNSTLVSGDTLGYVKVWDISEYCIKQKEEDQPKSSKKTQFTNDNRGRLGGVLPIHKRRHSLKAGAASRSIGSFKIGQVKCEPPPVLARFRAHLLGIVSLDYVNSRQLIVSASTDCSVRLWTHGGRYIGTFGQKATWVLERAMKGPRKLPHDIHRIASPDTLKMLGTSGTYKWRIAKHIMRIACLGRFMASRQSHEASAEDERAMELSIENSLKNVLGKYYRPKTRHRLLPPIQKPRFNHNQVMVYSFLPYKDLEQIDDLKLPPVLGHPNQKSSLCLLADSTEKGGRHMKTTTAASTPKPGHQGSRTPAGRESARKQNRTQL